MSPGATASGSNGDRSLAADCHGHLNRSAYRQLIYQLDVTSPILLVASRPGQLDHATIRLELLEARSRPTMRSQRSTGAARIKALRQGLFALLTGDRSPLDVHCPSSSVSDMHAGRGLLCDTITPVYRPSPYGSQEFIARSVPRSSSVESRRPKRRLVADLRQAV